MTNQAALYNIAVTVQQWKATDAAMKVPVLIYFDPERLARIDALKRAYADDNRHEMIRRLLDAGLSFFADGAVPEQHYQGLEPSGAPVLETSP